MDSAGFRPGRERDREVPPRGVQAIADAESGSRSRGLWLVATFVLLATAIMFIGYQAHQYNVRNLEARFHGALRAVAETKAERVGEWLGSHLQSLASTSALHTLTVHAGPALAGDVRALAELRSDMDGVARVFGKDALLLADVNGRELFAIGEPAPAELVAVAVRNATTRRAGVAVGTRPAGEGAIAVLAQPLAPHPGDGALYLVALLDLEQHLVPMVQKWLLSDSTGDSALASLGPGGELVMLPGFNASLAGDEVVRLPLASPATDRSETARRMVTGVFEGYHPDGRPVILAFARVPGIDWVVVSAMDRSELFAGTLALSRNAAVVVLLAVAIAGALILALFRQQQSFNRVIVDSVRRERDAVRQHFFYLSRFANDVALLTDSSGRVLDCNDRAISTYGYARDELLVMDAMELWPGGLARAARRQLGLARSESGLVFETWHRRSDGSEFPVEVSARAFEVDGEIFVQSIVRDITERKRVEEALQLSEARFRSIFDHSMVGLAHVFPDGRILLANRGFAEMLGYAVEELQGMSIAQITDPQYLDDELGLLRGLHSGRSDSFSIEKRYVRKDGSRVWGQLWVSAIRDELGKLDYLVGVVQNVSARKQLEAQLERRSELYRALSETNRAIARAQDPETLLREACEIAVSRASLSMAVVVRLTAGKGGCEVLAAAGPDARAMAEEMFRQVTQDALQGREQDEVDEGMQVVNDLESGPVSAGMRLACLRRGVRAYASFPVGAPAALRFTVFSSEAGFFEGDPLALLRDMARDLSNAVSRFGEREARERAEYRLQEVAAHMMALVDAAPVAVFDVDAEGSVANIWNPAAERMLGWRREEVLGRRVPIVPDDPVAQADFDTVRGRVIAGESIAGLEVCRNRRDGSPVFLSLSMASATGPDGRPVSLVVAEDITARQQAAEEMRRARDELEDRVRERTGELASARDRAEEADRIKTAFLANMSHELRTPLNSIIGFSSLMLSGAPGPVNEEQGKQLGIIRRSGERLLALIEDILDVSRLQSVDARLPREPTPLRDLLLRVADALRPQALGRGLALDTRIEPCVAMAEPRRLEQVLSNLVANAVKYTDRGGVILSCRCKGDRVEIDVTDTGIGISPEDLDGLFVPFSQLSRADSGRDGAGLGLAIARRLVEAMGGSIKAQSKPGRGSCFTVSLQAASTHGHEAENIAH